MVIVVGKSGENGFAFTGGVKANYRMTIQIADAIGMIRIIHVDL